MKVTSLRALFCGAALLALAAPAHAQDADAPASGAGEEQEAAVANEDRQAEDPGTQTGEIVVTARRRAESLIDVPIAVTAYTGEALEAQGALDITDISDTTPNVTLEVSRGTNTTLTAFIRGVGQQDPVAGFEGGVGIYLDDVFLNRPQAAVLDIYDVERIEVLRGPQGTLYGRNTIGGAVKYVTRRLSDDPQARVRANLGTYSQADLIASASTPVGDGTLRFGGAFARLTRDGFGKNLTTGQENYDRDVYAGRLSAEVNNEDNVFFRLAADYTRDKSNPRGGHRLIADLAAPVAFPVLRDEFDSRGGLVSPRQDIEAYGISLFGEVGLTRKLTFRTITGYREDESRTPIDFDALPAADVDVPAIYENSQLSQELQLVYESERLNGLVGVYYLDASARNIFDVVLATTAPAALPGLTASTFGDVDTETVAAFGDFTFDFTDRLSLSVGGRYTSDRREAVVFRQNLLRGARPELGGTPLGGVFNPVTNPTGRILAVTSDFRGRKTFNEFTPRVSVSFKPSERQNIYASYSKGFKGGGFDPRGVSTAAPDVNGDRTVSATEVFDFFLFEPEKVDSYEVGYKAALFDRRLNLAVAGFYADYKDVQVPGSVGAVVAGIPTFVGVTTNAGKARFKGIEAEALAVLAEDLGAAGSRLSLAGTFGFIDAEYREFVANVAAFDAAGNPAPTQRAQPVDVADFRRIQNTPRYTASSTLTYSTPLRGGELDLSGTVSYRSKVFQFETPSPFLDQEGFALADANLVYRGRGDRFTIGLHGRNLFDKRYITSGYQFLNVNPVTGAPILSAAPTSPNFARPGLAPSLGTEGVVTAFYGNPRQVFLSLGVNF